MGAFQSKTKVPPENDVYFFERAHVLQSERGRHSSNNPWSTSSSVNTASQPKQPLVELKDQSQTQTTREVQATRYSQNSQTTGESQAMREIPPTTSAPADTQRTTNPIELPLFREMAGICDPSETLSLMDLRTSRKQLFLTRLSAEHFQVPFERWEYENLCCRYCAMHFGTQVTIKSLAAHAVKIKHFKNIFAMGRSVPREDFEFWCRIISRAEQRRLEQIGKDNAERNWETTVVTTTVVPIPEPTVPAKETNMEFFYQDAMGDMQGPISEEQMQEWYRKGYFTSNILIGIGQKEQLVPFSALLAENGSSTPFTYPKKITKTSESYAVLTHRPWYLIPMLHPIAVPSQMLVTGEKLVDEVEKLREKFSSRNKDSLDDVLSHLVTRPMNCVLGSTTLFNSRSEFVAHILSRQHHEELWESLSGITKHDIDYWNYVLDLARPPEGPNESMTLYTNDFVMTTVNTEPVPGACQNTAQKNVANKAQAVPSEGPKDAMQVQRVVMDDMTNNSSSQKLGKKAGARKTRAQQYRDRQHPQVPTTVPFFKLTNTGPELTREAATSASACATLRGLFFRLSLEQMVEATMALSPRALTLCDFVGCPICEVPLQLGQSFMNHVLGKKHIAKLYTKNGAITQGDVDFYTKTIQECMK